MPDQTFRAEEPNKRGKIESRAKIFFIHLFKLDFYYSFYFEL
jgi:hypothetical protein